MFATWHIEVLMLAVSKMTLFLKEESFTLRDDSLDFLNKAFSINFDDKDVTKFISWYVT